MINENVTSILRRHPSRVLIWRWLQQNCKSGNNIVVKQEDIKREIGYSTVTIWKVFVLLEQLGLIVKNGRYGYFNRYILNPEYVWNGNIEDREAGVAEFLRLRGNNVKEN